MNNERFLANAAAQARDEWKYANGDDDGKLKMIYTKHNLKNNYMEANAAGDKSMGSDILISEIAKLIVAQPTQVVAALKKHGFTPASNNLHDITDAVGMALSQSRAFATQLAGGIISNQRKGVNEPGRRHFPASGDSVIPSLDPVPGVPPTGEHGRGYVPPQHKKYHGADGDVGSILQDSSSIISGLSNIFGKKSSKPAAATQQIHTAVAAHSGVKKAGLSVGVYIGIALGVVVVIFAVVEIVKQHKASKA